MSKPGRISVLHLMSPLDRKLIELLEGLAPEDWSRQTTAPQWKVKDVAAHLLDGNLRALSMLRDGFFGESPEGVNSYPSLVDFLNRLNADWVRAARRLSPRVLIDWLRHSGTAYCDYLHTLDPDAPAVFAVAWAGEEESKNWFHIAREYTEKWHHQQQIRLAVGQEKVLLEEKWYLPYLDTSVRALPHSYHKVPAKNGEVIRFVFKGGREKVWYLKNEEGRWTLFSALDENPACVVEVPDEIAWRIFTKGISRGEAEKRARISGKMKLGEKFFETLAVMA